MTDKGPFVSIEGALVGTLPGMVALSSGTKTPQSEGGARKGLFQEKADHHGRAPLRLDGERGRSSTGSSSRKDSSISSIAVASVRIDGGTWWNRATYLARTRAYSLPIFDFLDIAIPPVTRQMDTLPASRSYVTTM